MRPNIAVPSPRRRGDRRPRPNPAPGIPPGLLAAVALVVAGVAILAGEAAGGPIRPPADEPGGAPARDDGREAVLVRCETSCDAVARSIAAEGGVVTRLYPHLGGLAARLPREALAAVGSVAGPGAIGKDLDLRIPRVADEAARRAPWLARTGDDERIVAEATGSLGGAPEIAALATAVPEAYAVNAGVHGIAALHARGYTGEGIVVAVIDSGLRPGFPHLTSDDSILGGEDFVGDGLSWSSFLNDGHGTYVAGMISANAFFAFPANSVFLRAVRANLPGAIVGTSSVPMIGAAPQAQIYAMRVYSLLGNSPTSVVLAAIDRAIELRQMFDRHEYGGIDIRVANLSLSGPTLEAGHDLLDAALDRLLDADIVPVASAGNAGPAGLTIGSPGSSYGALNVGAASLPGNERILRQIQYGPDYAFLFRPWETLQMAGFSSRGPVADGRPDPDVVASGFACYGMGLSGPATINLASGTSFSAPTVAGVAAVLRQAFPRATARQIRNAILMGADPAAIPGATSEDRGAGLVNGQAAYDLLKSGAVPDTLPAAPAPVRSVAANIERGAGLAVATSIATLDTGPLAATARAEMFYAVPPNTTRLTITVSDIVTSLPPEHQSGLGGDDLELWVHSAKTSRQVGAGGVTGDYLFATFTDGGVYPVDVAETGLVRITLVGTWTNVGTIAARLRVVPEGEPSPQITRQGTIAPYERIVVPLVVPEGTSRADFRLSWRADWGSYPVNDIDLVVVDPAGVTYFGGATLAVPESLSILGPRPGPWQVRIEGFDVRTGEDRYKLRVAFDDRVVR